MVAIMLGADNGFFYAGQVMHFSSPFTVFLIYHKQIEEGDDISDSVKYGLETYVNLQQRYNLEFGSVTKDFVKQWKEEKRRRSGAMPNENTDENELLISNRKHNKEWIESIMEGMCRTDDDTMHEQYEYEQDELEWDDDL